jgi:sRNA-binding regulator protein Hfq
MNRETLTLPDAAVRQDQARYAQRADERPAERPKKKFKAVGHDIQLEQAQFNKFPTTIYVEGEDFTGVITRRDKFTITLAYETITGSPVEEIFYKHAIERVRIERNTQGAN